MGFDGKRVLVTGSTRGIGLATARAFLDKGASVVVHGRSQASVDAALKDLGGGIGIAADVATLDGCKGLIADTLAALGGLDILVNYAALGDGASFEESGERLWQATMDINLRAPFFLTQYALPALRKSSGNVVSDTQRKERLARPRPRCPIPTPCSGSMLHAKHMGSRSRFRYPVNRAGFQT